MDKAYLSAAVIVGILSLYFSYSPDTLQDYFREKGTKTIVVRKKGEDVRTKSRGNLRWQGIDDRPKILFTTTMVFSGEKSNANVRITNQTNVELSQSSIANFIIKDDIEGLDLRQGDASIRLSGGELYLYGKKRYKLQGTGSVNIKKVGDGLHIETLSDQITLLDDNGNKVDVKKTFLLLNKRSYVSSPANGKSFYILPGDTKAIPVKFDDKVKKGSLLIYKNGSVYKTYSLMDSKGVSLNLEKGRYSLDLISSNQSSVSFITIKEMISPQIEVRKVKRYGPTEYHIFSLDSFRKDISSVIFEGFDFKKLVWKKSTKLYIRLDQVEYDKLSSITASYLYDGDVLGPASYLHLKKKEIVKPVEKLISKVMKPILRNKVPKLAPVKKLEKVKKLAQLKKPFLSQFKYKKYFFSGNNVHYTIQERNDATSVIISAPHIGFGLDWYHEDYKDYPIDSHLLLNFYPDSANRAIAQVSLLDYYAAIKLYQREVLESDFHFKVRFNYFNYLFDANPTVIDFKNALSISASFHITPMVLQGHKWFDQNSFYFFIPFIHSGPDVGIGFGLHSILSKMVVYGANLSPFLTVEANQVSTSDYSQTVMRFDLGTFFN